MAKNHPKTYGTLLTLLVGMGLSCLGTGLYGAEPEQPELTVIYPGYRNQIQSKDPVKELRIRLDTHLKPGLSVYMAGELVSDTQLTDSWKATLKVDKDGSCQYARDLSDLSPGDYLFKLSFHSKDQILQLKRELPVRVLPPGGYEVTFDHRRICYVNGKPFFPLGIYHMQPAVFTTYVHSEAEKLGLPDTDWRQALADVKARGFNTVVHCWSAPSEAFLGEATREGLAVLTEGASFTDREGFIKLRSRADRQQNVLMWYGVDEPYQPHQIEISRNFYSEAAQVVDPHRPVGTAIGMIASLPPVIDSVDVVMPDYYDIRYCNGILSRDLSDYAVWLRETKKIAESAGKPMWNVPQAFAGGDDPKATMWLEPKPEQLRCQAYLGLVKGATGIIWYAYFTGETLPNSKRGHWYLPDSPLWDYFGKLNTEVARFGEVLVQSESSAEVEWSDPRLQSRLWACKGKTFIVAVNPVTETLLCHLTNPPGREAKVWSEDRKQKSQSGLFRDSFGPYAVHIYEFNR